MSNGKELSLDSIKPDLVTPRSHLNIVIVLTQNPFQIEMKTAVEMRRAMKEVSFCIDHQLKKMEARGPTHHNRAC